MLVASLWLAVIASRILGPSDLWDKEQPRTIAYTVDMVRYGNFILPYDAFGIPATKPPFYNWLSLPFVLAFGYAEWVHRLPAVLSSLAVILTLFLYGKSLQPRLEGGPEAAPWMVGALSSIMWLATPLTLRLAYVARPDMPLVALLTGAWAAGSVMIQSDRPRPGMAAAFWLCTLGAALDKGPLALFAVAYLVISGFLIRRTPRVLLRTGWWWGVPLLLTGSCLWLFAAYRQEPEYVRLVLLGHEVVMRFDPLESLKTFINSPVYPITGLFPWSLLVLGVLWAIGPRKWFSHPLAPAIIWVLLITVGLAFTAHRRRDWYAPVFPQMAIPAAAVMLGLMSRTRGKRFVVRPLHAILPACLLIAGTMFFDWTRYTYATTGWGDNANAFVRELKNRVGNEPVVFLDGERTGIESLLGMQQQEPPPPDLLASATWCVKAYEVGNGKKLEPVNPASTRLEQQPEFISDALYDGEGHVDGPDGKRHGRLYLVRLALFRLKPGEAAAEYALHQTISLTYDENEGLALTADGKSRKYARFWRQYGTSAQVTFPPAPSTAPQASARPPDNAISLQYP